MVLYKEHTLPPLDLPYVDPFDMRRLHGGAEPWARFHREHNGNDDIQIEPWQPEVWEAETNWTCRRKITSSKPISIPAWLCRMFGVSGCMRFEESQVSVFNPETGVNTVEASAFMILRAGPTHTCDIKMQQVPTMFGNAPGIVMTVRLRATGDVAGAFRGAAQGAVMASAKPVAEAFNAFGQRQVEDLQAQRRAEDEAHVCEWADVARRRIRGEAPWAPRSPLAPPADVPAPCPADSSAPRQGAHCCGSASEGACGPGAAKPDLKHSTAGDAGGPQPPVPQLPLGGFWPTPPASPVRRLMSTDSMATMYFDCDEDFHDASEDIEPERVPSTTAAPLLPGGTAAVVVAAPTRGKGNSAQSDKPMEAKPAAKRGKVQRLFGRIGRGLRGCMRPPSTVA